MSDEVVVDSGGDMLGMSDEAFAELDFNSFGSTATEEGSVEPSDTPVEDEVADNIPSEEDSSEEPIEASEEEGIDEEEETPTIEEEVTDNSEEIDYKAEYQKLFKPFKANGKEIQVDNAEDAIALMQMGANYNKKMAGLKPNLKIIKMLENNGLLSEDKLNYLIDLDKRNPEAIKKLIKDSGVDPLDLDLEAPNGYKPNTYNVHDSEIALDGILEEIQGTESFNQTIDIISNRWDNSSKKVLLDQPEIIKVLNEHVSNGIYQQITNVIESERMLGRLVGLSDIAAYKQVGEMINARGGFNKPVSKSKEPVVNKPNKVTVDPVLKSRKMAASSTKATVTAPVKQDFNPLAMSDAEFEKLIQKQFL